jgi:primosomal protein N' (replication factor Y) (superfamily II helicase)
MLNLVGVIDADLGLANGDPRAAERTFQLLHQVVGRAGRDAGIGRGYLQTHQPEHPVIRALIAQDRDAFYAAEIDAREQAHYPPFGRLASLVISGSDRHETAGYARALARAAPQVAEPELVEPDLLAPKAGGAAGSAALSDAVRVLGPADAPLSLVRGRHRLRLLVKAPRGFDLSAYLRDWLSAAPKKHGDIKLEVDVDPQSFL